MDDLENKTPAELTELKDQVASLQSLVLSVLVLVLVISGAFNLYVLREFRFVNAEVKAMQPQAKQMVENYEKSRPALAEFLKKLADYSHAHPDFAPIATKFRLNELGAKPAAAPASNAPAKK